MKKIYYILILLLLSSCFGGRTQRSNFYVLTPVSQSDIVFDGKNKMVGIDIIYIAGYLDRQEIITIKNNESELNMSDFNRWAEPLTNSLERNIVLNMSSYMNNSIIKSVNSFNKNFDYIVLIYLNRLDGKFNDNVYLEASYSIIDKMGNILTVDNISLKTSLANTYEDLVIKESELVSKLSFKIAETLSKLKK